MTVIDLMAAGPQPRVFDVRAAAERPRERRRPEQRLKLSFVLFAPEALSLKLQDIAFTDAKVGLGREDHGEAWLDRDRERPR